MEISPLTIYLINLVDSIDRLCLASGIIFFVLTAGCLFVYAVSISSDDIGGYYCKPTEKDITFGKKALKKVKPFFVLGLSLFTLSILIPGKADICAMYVVPAIVNNTEIKGLSEDVLKGMRGAAHEWALSFIDKKKEEK